MSARTSILTLCTAAALACSSASVATTSVDAPDRAGPPRWGPVRTLAPNPQSASIAVDGRGVTTVAWQGTDFPPSVVVRQRFPDGTWSKRTKVGQGVAPVVVADRRGVVTAMWITQREGFSDGVAAARLKASGRWSRPVSLSKDVSLPGYVPGPVVHGASDLDVAANQAGAVVAVWSWGNEDEGVPTRIQSAFRPKPGPWRKAVDVTPAKGADEPEVGIARDGTAIVVYGVQAFGEPQALVARVRGTGGRWGTPKAITAEGYDHDLAVAGNGRAVVVYSPDFSKVRAVTRSVGTRWGMPRTLARGGELNDVDVVANPRGRFVVGIARDEGRVDVVERGRRGGWSEPVRLAQKGTVAGEVVVAIDRAGDTFVGWGQYGVYARYREHGSPTWSRRYTAWPDKGVDVLEAAFAVMAPNGDVAVLWDQEAEPLRMRVLKTP
jgi:hypothetical protein